MKKLMVAVLLLTVLVGCKCPLLMTTVDRLEQSMDRQHRLYLQYVEADPKLTEPQKSIERDNTKSQKDLLNTIRRAHE